MDKYLLDVESWLTFEGGSLTRIPWETPFGVLRELYHCRVEPRAAARHLAESWKDKTEAARA